MQYNLLLYYEKKGGTAVVINFIEVCEEVF